MDTYLSCGSRQCEGWQGIPRMRQLHVFLLIVSFASVCTGLFFAIWLDRSTHARIVHHSYLNDVLRLYVPGCRGKSHGY
jgi:hypothetical protein